MRLIELILLSLTSLIICVSAKKTALLNLSDEAKLLKAVVYNLPSSCKLLNDMGTFNVRSAKSYACLFDGHKGNEDGKKVGRVMVLLMGQGKNEKLVKEIAKIWVEKGRWGPFNQARIADDLSTILSVKLSARYGDRKDESVVINPAAIYATFKILMETGQSFIIPDQLYMPLVAKVLNLTRSIDKSESSAKSTVSLLIKTLFPIDKLDVNNKMKVSAQAYSVTRSLNNLAKKGKIEYEAWELYAKFICMELNSNCSTSFGMVEQVIEESTRTSSESSSEYESSNSDSSDDKNVKIVKKVPQKFIEITSSPAISSALKLNATKANSSEFFSMSGSSVGFWMIVVGSILLSIIIIYLIYSTFNKRLEDPHDL